MVFSSTTFLFLFLPFVVILYYNPFFKGRGFRNILILLASLGFYAWGEPVFVFLMVLSIFITWLAGLGIAHKKSRGLLTAAVMYHVGILFVFKYLSFLSGQAGLLTGNNDGAVDIALPIGISFFTFQLLSYLFDVYYGKAEAQSNVLYLGLYISFFPQLIAGPIVRYSDIADQIENRIESREKFVSGMQKFAYGLSKKVLLADYVAIVADIGFAGIDNQSVLMAWLGAVAYALQIYFDFSGYSDMAIGLGRMFGFSFVENFNYPYISKSVTEFWRRWHISLSSWFRDYVYIPLGGNRCSRPRWILNMLVVWALTGIWHGANWTFLVWGLLYFVMLVVEKNTRINERLGYATYFTTAVAVVMNWVIFRADSLGDAMHYLGNMVGIGAAGGLADSDFFNNAGFALPVLVACAVGSTPAVKKMFGWLAARNLEWIESLWVLGIFLLSLIHAVASTYSPFIYFNF